MKLTWRMVYEDFKKEYPKLKSEATYYEPYDYAEIKIWMKDGSKFIYNYDAKIGRYVKDELVYENGKYIHKVIE